MDKIEQITKKEIWKYIYSFLIGYVFFSSIINEMVFKSESNPILYITKFHDEIMVYFSIVLIVRELLSFLCSISKKDNRLIKTKLLFFAILMIVYLGTKRKLYFVYALLIYESSIIGFDNLIRNYLYSKATGIICWLMLYVGGQLIETESMRNGLYLGTQHYNNAAYIIMYFLVAAWYVFGKNKKKLFICVTLASFLFDILILKSRTAMIMSFIFLILLIFEEKIHLYGYDKKIFTISFTYYPILMILIGFIIGAFVTYLYRKYNLILDYAISARFSELIEGYLFKGVSLFAIDFSDISNLTFDNTYANLIYKRGLLFTVIFLAISVLNNKKILREKNTRLLIVSVFLFTYGQMEYMLKGELIIVLLSYYFSSSNRRIKDNEKN